MAVGVVLVCLQVGILLGLKIVKYMGKRRISERLSLERLRFDRISSRQMNKLKGAYRHPWVGEREQIFDYYSERMQGEGFARYSDMNVEDRGDFKEIKNLKGSRVQKRARKSIRFLDEQSVKKFQEALKRHLKEVE